MAEPQPDDIVARGDSAQAHDVALEGELIEPGAPLATRPPGRKPMPPLHVIPPLNSEEVSILIADPHELLRRRAKDYIDFHHALISSSPSRLNRCAWAIESQRRAADTLLKLAIPPARTPGDQFAELRPTSDAELLAILASLGPDPAQSLGPAPEAETSEGE